jgi:glycosyltransferase involved in cell wall biosynthesis
MNNIVMMISSSIGGGAQILFANVIQELNNKYRVLAICPEGYLSKTLKKRGIEAYITEINPITINNIRRYVMKWANDQPFTLNPYLFGTAFFVCVAFRKVKTCKIFSLLLNPIVRVSEPKPKQIAYKYIAKHIGKHSNTIGVGSPELENEVMHLTGKTPIYLENRVPNKPRYRERVYCQSEAPLKVCFVGRMAYQKRPDIFVEAARIIHERGCNIQFYIAGEGELKAEIEDYIECHDLRKYVEFVGFIDDLYKFLYEMDVLALTSCFENTPLIVLDSMNAGVPVVSGNVIGVPHLICDGVDGIITKEYTAEAFADALQKISEDEELYERLSTNAYHKAITEFSFEKFIESYVKAL